MTTQAHTIPSSPRIARKRVAQPKKTKIELAREFEQLPDDSLTTGAHVAAHIDCSEAKLERDRWAGEGIPYIKVGRSVRYKKADVLKYLADKVRTSTTGGMRHGQ